MIIPKVFLKLLYYFILFIYFLQRKQCETGWYMGIFQYHHRFRFLINSTWTDCFYWSDLEAEGSELLKGKVIFKRAKVEFKSGEIKVTETEVVFVLAICKDVFCIIVLFTWVMEKCSLTVNRCNFSPNDFQIILITCLWNSLRHLFRSFCLFCNRYFITRINHFLYIFL